MKNRKENGKLEAILTGISIDKLICLQNKLTPLSCCDVITLYPARRAMTARRSSLSREDGRTVELRSSTSYWLN